MHHPNLWQSLKLSTSGWLAQRLISCTEWGFKCGKTSGRGQESLMKYVADLYPKSTSGESDKTMSRWRRLETTASKHLLRKPMADVAEGSSIFL